MRHRVTPARRTARRIGHAAATRGGRPLRTLQTVDAAENAHLRGRFAPVRREVTADDLPVEGVLPTDIDGADLRNGPNPKFHPLGSWPSPQRVPNGLHGNWMPAG